MKDFTKKDFYDRAERDAARKAKYETALAAAGEVDK